MAVDLISWGLSLAREMQIVKKLKKKRDSQHSPWGYSSLAKQKQGVCSNFRNGYRVWKWDRMYGKTSKSMIQYQTDRAGRLLNVTLSGREKPPTEKMGGQYIQDSFIKANCPLVKSPLQPAFLNFDYALITNRIGVERTEEYLLLITNTKSQIRLPS